MKKLRDFKCGECSHVQERLVSDETKFVECSKCESQANVALSAPKYFGNTTGRSPSAVS